MSKNNKYYNINYGPFPSNDGWNFIYELYQKYIKPVPLFRFFTVKYFLPFKFELVNNRKFYRTFGIDKIGRFIPTGGIHIRRITKSQMKPYTLTSISYHSAREFFYRTIVFEFLHLPFLITLLILVLHRLYIGEYRFAVENMLINIIFNIIPILHHRNTRARIVQLIIKKST